MIFDKSTYIKNKTLLNEDIYFYIAISNSINNNELRTDLLKKLRPEEQIKYSRYKNEIDKNMFLCSRTLLREEFQDVYNLRYGEELHFNEYKKPYIKKHPDIHFNISHSANRVMIGFSKYSLGVDIERIVAFDKTEILNMAKTVFNKSEVELLAQTDEINCRCLFTKIWTLKESIIKALGKGFGFDTKLLDFSDINSNEFTQIINNKTVCTLFSIYEKDYCTSISYIN